MVISLGYFGVQRVCGKKRCLPELRSFREVKMFAYYDKPGDPDFLAAAITCFTTESVPVWTSGRLVDSTYLANIAAGWGHDCPLGLGSHTNTQRHNANLCESAWRGVPKA